MCRMSKNARNKQKQKQSKNRKVILKKCSLFSLTLENGGRQIRQKMPETTTKVALSGHLFCLILRLRNVGHYEPIGISNHVSDIPILGSPSWKSCFQFLSGYKMTVEKFVSNSSPGIESIVVIILIILFHDSLTMIIQLHT